MDEGSRNSGRRPSAGEGPRWATRPWQGGHENLLKEESTSLGRLRACGRATRQGTERSVVAGWWRRAQGARGHGDWDPSPVCARRETSEGGKGIKLRLSWRRKRGERGRERGIERSGGER